jgi:hypothetical protein
LSSYRKKWTKPTPNNSLNISSSMVMPTNYL